MAADSSQRSLSPAVAVACLTEPGANLVSPWGAEPDIDGESPVPVMAGLTEVTGGEAGVAKAVMSAGLHRILGSPVHWVLCKTSKKELRVSYRL